MSRDETLEDLIALNLTGHIGIILYKRLLSYFGSTRNIMHSSQGKLERVEGIGSVISQAIIEIRKSDKLKKEIDMTKKLDVEIIPYYSDRYQQQLKNIIDYPILLYVKGEIKEQDQVAIAIVGTRQCSLYGKKTALKFAQELADLGICIVSGLARGIDTYAHIGALETKNGRTIAVAGSGLNIIYPPENRKLFYQICERGAVISEFGLDTPPDASNFPRRNRIIGGLSLGLLIVEAGEKSGALISADLALEQGKEIFCIPGNIDSPKSKGCNALIKQGAKLVNGIEDILVEIPECAEFSKVMLKNLRKIT